MLQFPPLEKREKQFFSLVGGKDFQFMRVFYIHQLVADVVGRFHEIYQRMSAELQFASALLLQYPQFVGNPLEILLFRYEEAEFLFRACYGRFVRVFYYRGEGGVGQGESSAATAVEFVGKEAECVGVPFEVRHVAPEAVAEHAAQFLSLPFGEVRGDCRFARVSERRVAHVVSKTGRCYNIAYTLQLAVQSRVVAFLLYGVGYVVAERTSDARHLEAVSKTVVYEYAAGEREYLRFVLQSAERRGKYQTVVVALELRTGMFAFIVKIFKTEPLR